MEATRTSRLRAVLTCWQLVTLKVKTNKLTEQIEHMKSTAEKTSTSIWQMNKAKLVETACDELGISEQEATRTTADMLRFMIKEFRGQHKPTTSHSGLPKGLSRMSHQELVVQADARGISVQDHRQRHGVKVRQRLILDLQMYEKARSEGRTFEEMTPDDLMEEDGFSSEFFTPPVGSSATPTGQQPGSASGSGIGSGPSSLQTNTISSLFAGLQTRR